MATVPPVNVDALFAGLRRALFYGARAAQLLRYAPEIIDMLYPKGAYPQMNDHDRALATERLIRQAIASIGGLSGETLATMLCLSPGLAGRALADRRRIAAGLFNRQPRTFYRGRYEQDLLYELAVEIYRIHTDTGDSTDPPATST
jgi:hypothetical protein